MQVAAHGFQTPQRQIQHPNFQTPHSTLPPPQRNNNVQHYGVVGPCYSSGQSGHYVTGVQGSKQIKP
jgi:hypothetical protein